MYSQCPECQTRFRVTADVLRIAHGTVRCGRCGSAFNALARLTDTLSTPPPPAELIEPGAILPPEILPEAGANGSRHAEANGHSQTHGSVTQLPDFHFTADDIERVFVDSRDWQRQFGPERRDVPGFEAPVTERRSAESDRGSIEESGAGDDPGDGPVVEVDETGTFADFEDITLEGERIHIEGLPDFLLDDDDADLPSPNETNQTGVEHLPPGLVDAELLEKSGPTENAESTRLVDAQLLEAELEQALQELERAARPDLDTTDEFEILRHVPESLNPQFDEHAEPKDAADGADKDDSASEAERSVAAPRMLEASDVTPHDPALPEIVPVAAAGHLGSPRSTGQAPTSSPMPSVVTAAIAPSAPATLGDLRSSTRRARVADRIPHPAKSISDGTDAPFDEALLADARPAPRNVALWGLGALLLAIVMAAQLTHHFRKDLLRDPTFGPALRRIYVRLHVPLDADWDLGAYALRQWGARDAAPVAGAMTVRASIKNRATFAQPMPLLRLDLEDRFGGLVATRDFAPREYLKNPEQATRMLAVGAEIEAELALAATTPDAVGYKLDVCLPEGSRTVCAQADHAREERQ